MMVLADTKEEDMRETERRLKEKYEKMSFASRISPYAKPFINVMIGLFVSTLQGCMLPLFGITIGKVTFALMKPDPDEVRDEADKWCLYMLMIMIGSFFTAFSQKFAFGVVGENITLKIRERLYSSILKKHIGWFDERENAPGVLTTVLASDV